MSAVTDIQSWVKDYQELYGVFDKFLKSSSAADIQTLDAVSGRDKDFKILFKSLKGRAGTFKNSSWSILSLKDSDLNNPNLLLSIDLFNTIASDTVINLSKSSSMQYLKTRIKLIEDLLPAYENGVSNRRTQSRLTQIIEHLIVCCISEILILFHPYHLFCHFAWHSTNTHKQTNPEDILTAYYEFFTEIQWAQITTIVSSMVKKDATSDLYDQILIKNSNKVDIRDADLVQFERIEGQFESNLQALNILQTFSVVTINTMKLLIDTFVAGE